MDSKKVKGGKEKMETLKNQTLFQESCQYCGKKFPATPYEEQAISWKESHERHCPMNPSKKENVKKQ